MAIDQALEIAHGPVDSSPAPRLAQSSDQPYPTPLFAKWRAEGRPRRIAPEERLAQMDVSTKVGSALFMVVLLTMVVSAITGFGAISLLLMPAAAVCGLFLFRKGQVEAESFSGVFDSPSDLLQFAVLIKLRAGSIEYGSDLGVVSFSDGWLHYQGKLTEFHVARDSTDRGPSYPNPFGLTEFDVGFRDGAVNATARFAPVTRTGALACNCPRSLLEGWQEWRMTPNGGRSLFPPCVPQERAIAVARRKARRLRATLVMALLFALCLALSDLAAPALCVTAGLITVVYLATARARVTVSALERMRRETPCLSLIKQLNSQVRWAVFQPRSFWWK